jgi:hypothetical protein
MRTSGGIQIALTTFVIAFPAVVCGVFFLILWKRPFVFYPPGEFRSGADVTTYVEAMSLNRTPQITPISETVIQNLEATLSSLTLNLSRTNDPKQQAALFIKEAVIAVQESVIRVDSRPYFGSDGMVWEVSYDPTTPMHAFLDSIYYALDVRGIPPYSYGQVWAIKNVGTNETITQAGRVWADLNRKYDDERPISEVGLKGGTSIEIVPIGEAGMRAAAASGRSFG